MGKFLKKFICFGLLSGLGYLGFKLYLKIRAAINLSSSLPEYLKNIYEEVVKIDVRITITDFVITVSGSGKIAEKSELIKKTVTDYVEDFYPELKTKYLKVIVEEDIQQAE